MAWKKDRIWILGTVLAMALFLAAVWIPRPSVTAWAPVSDDFTLVIDAGHGGEDGGAVSVSGRRESEINLEIALRVEALSAFLGLRPHMIRETDTAVYAGECRTIAEKKNSDLHRRAEIVEGFPSAILLSIHQNHFPQSKYGGAQVFYSASAGSRALAEEIQESLRQGLDPRNRRQAKRSAGVYLMEHVTCPAVLVECGFLSNHREDLLLQQADYQKKLAMAILVPVAELGKAGTTDHEV